MQTLERIPRIGALKIYHLNKFFKIRIKVQEFHQDSEHILIKLNIFNIQVWNLQQRAFTYRNSTKSHEDMGKKQSEYKRLAKCTRITNYYVSDNTNLMIILK